MNINLLRTYLVLVKCDLNFTLAAKEMGISQPAVTKNIKTLETLMGGALFMRRGKKRYQLTDKGKTVLPVIETIVEQTRQLLLHGRDRFSHERLDIATTHDQMRYGLPGVVLDLLKVCPGLTVNFLQMPAGMMASAVSTGMASFAVVTEPVSVRDDIRILPCYRQERSLIIPVGHPLARLRNPSFADLASYPLVTSALDSQEHTDLCRAFVSHNLMPHVVISAPDVDIIRHYVRTGVGIGITTTGYGGEEEGVLCRSLAHLLPGRDISVLVSKNRMLSDTARECIGLFAPHIRDALVDRSDDIPEPVPNTAPPLL